jgi:hypothetical protein
LEIILVVNAAQGPYIELPTASYTEYCKVDGCVQNGTDVVNASGAVVPPAVMSNAIVYSSSAPPLLRAIPRTVHAMVIFTFVVLAIL